MDLIKKKRRRILGPFPLIKAPLFSSAAGDSQLCDYFFFCGAQQFQTPLCPCCSAVSQEFSVNPGVKRWIILGGEDDEAIPGDGYGGVGLAHGFDCLFDPQLMIR